ncbi:hypothetical protein HanRHA438_Chr03g0107781 [Helianthus annuus]|nr:hypothetical protein HanRHA438_Chr03g0107781 [Helianthus annuus]
MTSVNILCIYCNLTLCPFKSEAVCCISLLPVWVGWKLKKYMGWKKTKMPLM